MLCPRAVHLPLDAGSAKLQHAQKQEEIIHLCLFGKFPLNSNLCGLAGQFGYDISYYEAIPQDGEGLGLTEVSISAALPNSQKVPYEESWAVLGWLLRYYIPKVCIE